MTIIHYREYRLWFKAVGRRGFFSVTFPMMARTWWSHLKDHL